MRAFLSILILFISLTTRGQEVSSILDKEIIPPQNIVEVVDLLDKISQDLGFSLSYNSDILPDKTRSFDANRMTVRRLLQYVFDRQDLHFQFVGNQLVIYVPNTALVKESDNACYQSFAGLVVDVLTDLPIPKATVRGKDSDLMTVTNEDGKFALNFPCDSDIAQLSIQAPGYHTKIVYDMDELDLGTIELEGSYIKLNDKIVSTMPVENIVEDVLKNVSSNYRTSPSNSKSFFREAIVKNGEVAALSEAAFNAYNSAYADTDDNDQVQLINGRRYNGLSDLDSVRFKLKRSLESCFDLDVIKNPPAFLLPDEGRAQYRYVLKDIIEMDGRMTYLINFRPKSTIADYPYEGTMYIDKELHSLQAISFELNRKMLRNYDIFVIKSPAGTNTRFIGSKYYVNYTHLDDKLVMNYASIMTQFKVKNERRLSYSKYQTISEYVVNEFETDNVAKIRSQDAFITGRVFMEEPLTYDPDYWRGMNYIPLEKTLTRTSEKLKSLLQE